MTKNILRLLIIDDSPDDADQLARQLRIARYMLKTRRVADAAGLRKALESDRWDAVVSEHALPGFDARAALELINGADQGVPLIVFTRSITDDAAVALMDAGARDVVSKDHPARLIPALKRELAGAADRSELARVSKLLKELDEKHQAMVETTTEAISYCHEGMHIQTNQAYLELFGYSNIDELEGVPLLDLIEKSDHQRCKEFLRHAGKQSDSLAGEFVALRHDGAQFNAELTVSRVNMDGEDCTQIKVVDITSRKLAENRLKFLSERDALTGTYNRHYFQQLLNQAIERAGAQGSPSILIYIDLYDLQKINRELGYTVGDRMLLRISKLFGEQLDEDAVLARVGGDEFAVLLRDGDEARGREIAAKLADILKASSFCERGKTHRCNSAFSQLVIDGGHGDAQSLMTAALSQCEKKREPAAPARPAPAPVTDTPRAVPPTAADSTAADGAEPAPSADEAPEPGWAERIRAALAENRFQLNYQPIVNLHGRAGEFYEVLVRMLDEDGAPIPPAEFIPEAQGNGLLIEIDRWVVKNTVQSQAALHQQERAVTFFINLSEDAISNPEFIKYIEQCVRDNRIEPHFLVLEIDEPAISAHPDAAHRFLAAVTELGCLISLDNYANDCQTLLGLPRKSVKYLKIDGKMASRLEADEDREALMELMEMTKKLDIRTVAKFVEDAASLSRLWTYGFDYVQGNYFQAADTELGYAFGAADETTLDSDNTHNAWRA